jgi:hypothetical protein
MVVIIFQSIFCLEIHQNNNIFNIYFLISHKQFKKKNNLKQKKLKFFKYIFQTQKTSTLVRMTLYFFVG